MIICQQLQAEPSLNSKLRRDNNMTVVNDVKIKSERPSIEKAPRKSAEEQANDEADAEEIAEPSSTQRPVRVKKEKDDKKRATTISKSKATTSKRQNNVTTSDNTEQSDMDPISKKVKKSKGIKNVKSQFTETISLSFQLAKRFIRNCSNGNMSTDRVVR